MLVDRLRDFEAAAAYIGDRADGPKEPGDNPKGREPRFLAPAEDTHLQAGLRLYCPGEFRPVRSATHGLGRHGVDSNNPHGLGNSAKSAHSLYRATKMVRRDCAGLGEPFGEAAKRFFIEARHRRPAELVIDQEPDRVRADVDDRIGRPVDPLCARGVELKRRRPFRRLNASFSHRSSSTPRAYHGRRRGPADSLLFLLAQTAAGAPVRTGRSAAWQSFSETRLPRAEFKGSRTSSIAHKSCPMVPETPSLNQAPTSRGLATPASVWSSNA